MPTFDVHSYSVVRIKVTGIEATDHAAAIAALEADPKVMVEASALISYDKPGAKISAIEIDDGAQPVGYLVDRVGDTDFAESKSYDVTKDGAPVEIGSRPGEGKAVNIYQRTALEKYAHGDLVPIIQEAADQFSLTDRLTREYDDLLPTFIAKELAGVESKDDAIDRVEDAIRDLIIARDRLILLGE